MSKIRRGESVKKKNSRQAEDQPKSGRSTLKKGQRSVTDRVEASGAAQSAADRRAAEAELSTLVDEFTPDRAPLITALRKSLRKRLPTAHEVVYEYRDCFVTSFSPSGHGFEGVLAIRGSADAVKIYFNQGKDLPDPEKLLQGSAGQVRFICVGGASDLARPPVARLIDEAIARNRVPFATAGQGSVVMSASTSAKSKTRRTRPA